MMPLVLALMMIGVEDANYRTEECTSLEVLRGQSSLAHKQARLDGGVYGQG